MKNFKSKMKLLACLSMLLSFVSFSYSQNSIGYDCGELKMENRVTEWVTVKYLVKNTADTIGTNWTYSEWEKISYYPLSKTNSGYDKCVTEDIYKEFQKRINNAGVIQQRKSYIHFWYEKPPLSEYEKKVQSFNK